MKYLGMMNGWKQSPHCWKNHIFNPLGFEGITNGWISFTILGIVLFFETPKWLSKRV